MTQVHRRVEQVMGMPISLALRGRHEDDERGEAAWQAALEVLHEADRVFSTYRSDSVVSRLARRELSLDECPDEVRDVLALGEQARKQSGGAFDVRRAGPDGQTVLDPSGVVKGWAVDRAARAFDGLAETDVCLSAGGDMVCRTRQDVSPGWRIGIEHPHDPSKVVAVVPVRNGAVATSGLAHRGDHIVDARTGRTPGRDRLGHGRRTRPGLGRHRRHRRFRDGRRRPRLATRPRAPERPCGLGRRHDRPVRRRELTALF